MAATYASRSTTGQAASTRTAWSTTLLSGVTMFALLDIARLVFPSIAFIYGRAGSTPAGEMGLFALLLFGTAGLVGRIAGVTPTYAGPAMIAVAAIARVALLVDPGGTTQLMASSIGLVAIVGLCGALAASDLSIRDCSRGLALGIVVSLTIHTMLGTYDSIWLGGGIGWLVTVSVTAAMAGSWWYSRPTADRPEIRSTIPWLLIGPILALQGIAASTPGSLRGFMGEAMVAPGLMLVTASAAGYLAARYITSSFARDFSGILVLVPASLTAVLLAGSGTAVFAALAALASSFLCTLALTITGEADDDALATRGRRSAAPAFGMIMAFVVVFGYYASYEIQIGFPRGILPSASAILIGLVLFRLRPAADPDSQPTLEDVGTLAFAPFLLVFVLLAGQARVLPPPFDASLDRVRVMTWNVAMGYDHLGRFNPHDIASTILSQSPDVLVLNEVDRGWLLAGGHDLMQILANDLQMHYAFAPAADSIWGNAILSRYPIEDVVTTTLPGDAAMNRSVVSARIRIGDDTLGVVGAHLHHLEDGDAIRLQQVEAVAAAARELEIDGVHVVIMGDFNATPGSDTLAALEPWQDLVKAGADGAFTPTYPATGPTEQIDHIFGTTGFNVSGLTIVATTSSDHLPVAVTISLNRPSP